MYTGYFRIVSAGVALVLILSVGACSSSQSPQPEFNKPGNPEAIQKLLHSDTTVAHQEGIAAAILLDTTGSMQEEVLGADKKPKAKIDVARMALLKVLQQFSTFAGKNPDKKILVGVYEFSSRPGLPPCRQLLKLGPPDLAAAHRVLAGISAEGATPIGDAMIAGKRDLDATGFSHRHLLVITDGENNRGYMPGDVAEVIAHEPEENRAAIYFIAFDLAAELFEPVKGAGGLVLAAQGEQQLTDTLDYILTGKILVEQPSSPVPPPGHPIPREIKKQN
jgi:hypothetical protein